jgi:hypothetical protein
VNGDDIDVTFGELPEEEDWILHGPYSDKTLLRNILIYDLARETGEYASRGFFVDLEVNGSYEGIYILMEKIKRDDFRLDISNLRPSENSGVDLTGGYILKIDKTSGDTDNEDWEGDAAYSETISFRSEYSVNGEPLEYSAFGDKRGEETYYLYEDPDAEDITEPQKEYIQSYIHRFEAAVASDQFDLVYNELIDLDSFVNHFLLNELSGNPDAYRLSTYLHKDKEGKLRMGPIWDFNIAFGNEDRSKTDEWIYTYNTRNPGDLWLVPFYWESLMENEAFRERVKSRWNELRADTFRVTNIHSQIDRYVAQLEKDESIRKNFERWQILGEQVAFNSYVGETYEDEVDYLKDWIEQRIAWLDTQIAAF